MRLDQLVEVEQAGAGSRAVQGAGGAAGHEDPGDQALPELLDAGSDLHHHRLEEDLRPWAFHRDGQRVHVAGDQCPVAVPVLQDDAVLPVHGPGHVVPAEREPVQPDHQPEQQAFGDDDPVGAALEHPADLDGGGLPRAVAVPDLGQVGTRAGNQLGDQADRVARAQLGHPVADLEAFHQPQEHLLQPVFGVPMARVAAGVVPDRRQPGVLEEAAGLDGGAVLEHQADRHAQPVRAQHDEVAERLVVRVEDPVPDAVRVGRERARVGRREPFGGGQFGVLLVGEVRLLERAEPFTQP